MSDVAIVAVSVSCKKNTLVNLVAPPYVNLILHLYF